MIIISSLLHETKYILKKYNISLSRRLGQNFLINEYIRNKIINYANLNKKDTVLEIGPGIGTLTIPMAKHAKKVIAIEKDCKMVEILKDRIHDLKIDNIEIINADALKIKFPKFNKVVSNLPYTISSPITFKLLNYDFNLGVLMYQKEFAQRLIAKPGTSNYSRLSVMMYFKANVKLLDIIPPKSFIPRPKVKSAIVKIIPKKKFKINRFFENVCRALFQHKRKKSKKALIESSHELNMNKSKLKQILERLDPKLAEKRVFKLTPNEILKISKFIEEHDKVQKP